MKLRLTKNFSIRIHDAGKIPVTLFSSLFVVVLLTNGLSAITTLLLFVVFFVCWFFRDPERVIPDEKGIFISPADGQIVKIEETLLPPELRTKENEKTKFKKVAIFMSVMNVHVQRVPVSGIIKAVEYVNGAFINATLDKASEDNERSLVLMESNGMEFGFVQISGLLARRIVNTLVPKQKVEIGEKYGIIKLGSRVEVYLPFECKLAVKNGQTTVGGETILARFEPKIKDVKEQKEINGTATKKIQKTKTTKK